MDLYDKIQTVVDYTNFLLTDRQIVLNFLYGSAREIQQRLVEWSKDPDKKANKYPCLLLFTPNPIGVEQTQRDYETDTVAQLVIVNDTEKTYTTPQRILHVYKPTLRPIYRALMEAFKLSPEFNINSDGRIPHEYIERYHYAPTPAHEQNVFSAVLDAIEINDLELIMVSNPCETATYDITYNVIHKGDNVTHEGENVTHTVTYVE